MNLDDLRQNWRTNQDRWAAEHLDPLAAQVVSRAARFEAQITRRDWIEAGAATFVILFFAWALATAPLTPLMQLGIVIIMLGALEIVIVLFWARRRAALPQPETSLAEFTHGELARVDRQISLLRRVTWWYSGPPLVGVSLLLSGMMWALPELSRFTWLAFFLAFHACLVLAGFIVYRINQRAVETELIPLRRQIAEFQSTLADPSEARD